MNNPPNNQGQPQFQPQQPPPGQYGPPGAYPPPGQYYPPPTEGMSGTKLALIIVGAVFGVLFLGGVLVGVLAVAVTPKLTEAKTKLEAKQMGDLRNSLLNIAADETKKQKLRVREVKDAKGEEFWMQALQHEILDPGLSKKVVSLNSRTDSPLGPGQVATAGGTTGHASYTAPKGSGLLRAMSLKGAKRCVVVTFNSRNWNNYPDAGVPCIWSDSDVITWMKFEEAQRDWGITAEEWADPAGKLFGKKAPFENTYD